MAKGMILLFKKLRHQRGMTLVEVMIAMAIFSVFIVAFMGSQGQVLFDSTRLKKELTLKDLAELVINEKIVDPPEFKENLTSASKETKTFEDYPEYQYTVELKKLTIPDLSKLLPQKEEDDGQENAQQQAVQKRVLKAFKDNMEKMIWQIRVTVENKETGESYYLNSWLYNDKATIDVQSF